MNYTISRAHWPQQNEAIGQVRTRVFVEEQSVPSELEWDDLDDQASHWLACSDGGDPIGTIRMLPDGHIGRMAVLLEYRGCGVGRALLQTALATARDDAIFEAYLYAQVQAVDFYKKQGFVAYGEEFMDANIPHQTMRLQLAQQRLLGVHGGNFAPSSHAEVALDIIAQANKQLRILSYNLDPTTFENSAVESHLSALARKSRYSEVRLLIVDSDSIVKRGHRLLNLQRRLSSAIQIRRVRNEAHEIKDNLILADGCGVVCQSISEPDKLWANFNNRPVATNYISQFDDLWERGILDNDLRRLEL